MSYYDDIFDDLDLYLNEDYEFDNELEYLDERVIYKGNKPKICIGVNDDIGGRFKYLPYFKIVNGDSLNDGTKIARISFKDHCYVIHHDNKKHWELSTADIKYINKILSSIDPDTNNTFYENLLIAASELCNISVKQFIEEYDINLNPDISDIHYKNNFDRQKAKEKGI